MLESFLKLLQNIKDPKVLIALAIGAIIWGAQLNFAVMGLAEKTGALEQNNKAILDAQRVSEIRAERFIATLEGIASEVKDNKISLREISHQLLEMSKHNARDR